MLSDLVAHDNNFTSQYSNWSTISNVIISYFQLFWNTLSNNLLLGDFIM